MGNLFELLTRKVEAVPSGCHVKYFKFLELMSVHNVCMMKTHRHGAMILHPGRWSCNCGRVMLACTPNCTVCKLSRVSSLKQGHSHCSHKQQRCHISGLKRCARDFLPELWQLCLFLIENDEGAMLLVNITPLYFNYFPSFGLEVVVIKLLTALIDS